MNGEARHRYADRKYAAAMPIVIFVTVEWSLPEHDGSINNGLWLCLNRWELQMTASFSTVSLTRRIRISGMALGFAAIVSTLSAGSSFAFSSEAQQMCTGDAFRLCSSEIPNISKITACMVKNRANLSAGCRAVMDKDAGKAASRKLVSAADGE
jgi:hypothetical protein